MALYLALSGHTVVWKGISSMELQQSHARQIKRGQAKSQCVKVGTNKCMYRAEANGTVPYSLQKDILTICYDTVHEI